MKIFVLRHGMTSNADADELRELTETGVREVEDVVNLRRDDLSGVTRIYSSPLLRVKQTLKIAARILEFQDAIVESHRPLNVDLVSDGVPRERRRGATKIDHEAGLRTAITRKILDVEAARAARGHRIRNEHVAQ